MTITLTQEVIFGAAGVLLTILQVYQLRLIYKVKKDIDILYGQVARIILQLAYRNATTQENSENNTTIK